MLSALLKQEHYGLRFTDFVKGYYLDEHPGMAYLELKGLLITKGTQSRVLHQLYLIQGTPAI
jgi:hypothetical protein